MTWTPRTRSSIVDATNFTKPSVLWTAPARGTRSIGVVAVTAGQAPPPRLRFGQPDRADRGVGEDRPWDDGVIDLSVRAAERVLGDDASLARPNRRGEVRVVGQSDDVTGGPDVRLYGPQLRSTATKPRSSRETPARSRPRPSVFGPRPMATSSFDARRIRPAPGVSTATATSFSSPVARSMRASVMTSVPRARRPRAGRVRGRARSRSAAQPSAARS